MEDRKRRVVSPILTLATLISATLLLATPIGRSLAQEGTLAGTEFCQISVLHAYATSVVGLNDQGQIIGTYWKPDGKNSGPAQGFLWDHGNYSTFRIPHTIGTLPCHINNRGEVVGLYFDAQAHERGFLWSKGVYTKIDFLGTHDGTSLACVNIKGEAVGDCDTHSSSGNHGFLFDHGVYTAIEPPDSKGSSGMESGTMPRSINDAGQVVGDFRDKKGHQHGFLLSGGVYTTLDFPGTDGTINVDCINNAGQVAGNVAFGEGRSWGFLWTKGVYTKIDFDNGWYTSVLGLNDQGQVVGNYEDNDNHLHGFLWEHGTFKEIAQPLHEHDAYPKDINNSGQIAGDCRDKNDKFVSFFERY